MATRGVAGPAVDETQAIHRALHELAKRVLPQYAPDDGPLSAAQVQQIEKRVAKRPAAGPVALWDGLPRRTASEHERFARGADAIRSRFEGVAPAILQADIDQAVRVARKARVRGKKASSARKKP